MTLASGRELAEHGLPSVEHLTVMAAGHRWVDQQWLAQAIFYEAARVGLGIAVGVYLLAVGATFALCADAARRRGASSGAILLAAILTVVAAPWSLQLRAQALSLPLFALTIWLLTRDPRLERRSTLWVVPALCLWANLHGSVTLGALMVVLCALRAVITQRSLRAAPYLALAPLAVFASPYAPKLAGYYRLLLFDPPFGREIVEWERTTPSAKTAVFFVVAIVSLVLIARHRRRLNGAEWICLAVTLASALEAIRGVVWFVFAAFAIVTPLAGREARRIEGKGAGVLVAVSLTVAAGGLVFAATRPAARYESRFPAALAEIARSHPTARVLADGRTADWLLWEVPALRGRVAYDVRFELLTKAQFRTVPAFDTSKPGWQALARGYDLVVDTPHQIGRLVRLGGWRRIYADGNLAVAERRT